MKSAISKLLRRFGLKLSHVAVSPFEHLLTLPRYEETTVSLLGKPFRVTDAASFYWSHNEIFGQQIYRFVSATGAPVIVDCGANYGTSVVYFKQLYPAATITAIEPDPSIFQRLAWNVEQCGFTGISLVNKAISNEVGPLRFFHEGADGGRLHFMAGARATIEVEVVTLDSLLNTPIDFLKMDIEGAETAVICNSEKLGNVAQIFIEYHSFADAPQTLDALLHKLSAAGFRYYVHTQFCSPRPFVASGCQLGMDLQLNIFAMRAVTA